MSVTAEKWGFCFKEGYEIVMFSTSFRPAVGPTPARIYWTLCALPRAVRRPGPEPDHSRPSNINDEN
jgi:hypothetical protein